MLLRENAQALSQFKNKLYFLNGNKRECRMEESSKKPLFD